MTVVRIIKNWQWPDILRQTSGSLGSWADVHFTLEETSDPDYVLVLNYSTKEIKVNCDKKNIWCILQEPPNEYFKYRHRANEIYFRVFTQDSTLKGERYVHVQPALPWHINKSYDELKTCKIPKKTNELSFILSNKRAFSGQRDRLGFLAHIKNKLDFDLFGYGLNPLKDKWDGLARYKYSLVVENYSCPDYWSEKLADCFLACTFPIYFGCTNLSDYFPRDSYCFIDIKSKDVADKIKEAVNNNLYEKNLKAVIAARRLILEKYQLFPFICGYISNWEAKYGKYGQKKEMIRIPKEDKFFDKTKFTGNPIIKCWNNISRGLYRHFEN